MLCTVLMLLVPSDERQRNLTRFQGYVKMEIKLKWIKTIQVEQATNTFLMKPFNLA